MADFRTARERIGGVFRVTRLYLGADGLPRVDLMNGHGQAEHGIPVPVLGGANGRYIYVPPNKVDGEEQATMVAINGNSLLPTMGRPRQSMGADFNPQFEPPLPDDDYPDQQALEDLVLASGGSKVLIAADGSVVLSSPEVSPLRINLPLAGKVRINQVDAVADETVPLGNATLTLLQDMNDKLSELALRVKQVDARVGALTDQLRFAVDAATYNDFRVAVRAPAFASASVPTVQSLPTPDEAVLASVFAISNVSKKTADEGDIAETV